ncbi:MAG: GlcG/HbpS family heme-binding protein [Pseudolabrys sp.]
MRRLSLVAIAATAALLFGAAVHAQQQPAAAPPPLPDYGPNITLEQAMKAGNAALAEAKKMNLLEGIAVVDTAGRLVYFIKMDNSRAIAVELAQHKARAAAMFKLPSKAYEDRVASGGAGITALSLDGVIAAAGGIPILINGKIIGAIGVGGGPNGNVDSQVAQAGIAALK